MLNAALVLAAESAAHESGGPNPYLIGGITLAILILSLLAVVSVGGGREHS